MYVEIVVPNLAALCAAVFTLSAKKKNSGGGYPPLPVGARVNLRLGEKRRGGGEHYHSSVSLIVEKHTWKNIHGKTTHTCTKVSKVQTGRQVV